jgi:hypothetical protein
LATGMSGRNTNARSATWRRRRLHASSTTEPLEARVLLSAGVETAVNVDLVPGTSPVVSDTGPSTSADVGSSASQMMSEPVGTTSNGDVGNAAPESSCSYDLCGQDVGGEIMGGDPSGELGGVDISGDVGGQVGGDIGGVDVGGDGPHPDPGIDVGGGDGGDVDGNIGGGVGGDVGDVGGDAGGGGEVETVMIGTLDDEAWEGPYSLLEQDRGEYILYRTSGGSELTVTLELTGTAKPEDYHISTDREQNPPIDIDGRVRVTFATNSLVLEISVRALLDGDYELPETVIATIVKVSGNHSIGAPSKASITIIDKQADLDITSIGSNGVLNEDEEDAPGADIRLNNDFDAEQSISDVEWYSSLVPLGRTDAANLASEDDFSDLNLTDRFSWPNDIPLQQDLRMVLHFNPLLVRIWQFRPGADGTTDAIVIDDGDLVTAPDTLKVEGIGAGMGTISLNWYSTLDPTQVTQADSVTFTVWDVDLDIDSDNTWEPIGEPDRDDWEEFVEFHPYGLGKLLYPAEHYERLRWPQDENRFTEMAFEISESLNATDEVAVTFSWQGVSGTAQLWSMPSNVFGGLIDAPLEDGGHRISNGRRYTLEELDFALSESRIELNEIWIEATHAQFVLDKQVTIESFGRPDDRIDMKVEVLRNESWQDLLADTVKYMVVSPETFFPSLQWGPPVGSVYDDPIVLRDGIASGIVYRTNQDGKDFALKLLSAEEMVKLGIPAPIVSMIVRGNGIEGFRVALYRDYASVGAPFVLAFAGTNDSADAIEDIVQALGDVGTQYPAAMQIAVALTAVDAIDDVGIRTTGHSLGGGLASAASVASGITANTFNAAGLHENTLYVNGDTSKRQLYRKIRERFDEAANTGLINAWYLEYDVLSFFQDNSNLPNAIGARHMMQGPHVNGLDRTLIYQLANELGEKLDGSTWLSILNFVRTNVDWLDIFSEVSSILFLSHSTRYYYYGLMVRHQPTVIGVEIIWDIYGDNEVLFY